MIRVTDLSSSGCVIKCMGFIFLFLLFSAIAEAQTASRTPLPVGEPNGVYEAQQGPLAKYRAHPINQSIRGDSPRMDTLVRAGNLYLSLRDAVALAIENNLDVEYQRITPFLAEADLLRARAGGVARGVPSDVREGPSGLGSSGATGISGTTGLQGQPHYRRIVDNGHQRAGSGPLASASGPSIPNLDPTLVGSLGLTSSNRPQTNTFITGTNATIIDSRLGNLQLQQGFLFGGVVSAGFDATRQDTNNLRADVNPATTAGLVFNFDQPLSARLRNRRK